MSTPRHQSRAWLLWLAAVAAVAAAAVMLCTAKGVMANPDSAVYMAAARSLAAGRGYKLEIYAGPSEPLTHFPPLLPALLAGPAALGWDLLKVARWLDALMLAGTVLVVGWLVYRHTGDKALAVLGAVLTTTGPPLLVTHTALLSEPPCVFLLVLGILLLDGHLRRPRMSLLVGSAAAFALALLTRWAAAPFLGAAWLVLLIWGQGDWRRRLWESTLFGVIACVPPALWVARDVAVGGSAADRAFVFHPVTRACLREGLTNIAAWVVPDRLARKAWMNGFVLVVMAGLIVWGYVLWRRRQTADPDVRGEAVHRPPYLLLAASAAYLAFVAISISFFDALTTLSDRTLVPVYVTGVVLVLWLAKLAVVSLRSEKSRRTALTCICAGCALLSVPHGLQHMVRRSHDGAGFTRRAWRESATLKAALAKASSVPVYASNAAVFYVLGGVAVHHLPRATDPNSTLSNPAYAKDFAGMVEDLQTRGAVIVLFAKHDGEQKLPAEDPRLRDLPLHLLQKFPDGAIYGLAPK